MLGAQSAAPSAVGACLRAEWIALTWRKSSTHCLACREIPPQHLLGDGTARYCAPRRWDSAGFNATAEIAGSSGVPAGQPLAS